MLLPSVVNVQSAQKDVRVLEGAFAIMVWNVIIQFAFVQSAQKDVRVLEGAFAIMVWNVIIQFACRSLLRYLL